MPHPERLPVEVLIPVPAPDAPAEADVDLDVSCVVLLAHVLTVEPSICIHE